ncbi:MAG: DUF58 domain-containing protein, partial [Micromonosporaceae bacterium]
STVAYVIRAEARGRYRIGPLQVRLSDPFGLCELVRAFPTVSNLIVTPQVAPLPSVRVAGEHVGSGASRARSVAVHGEDDTATREYRHGDDLRRVHWRSTARVGELMVRREEQPWESRATIVLDPRLSAHRGEGPTSSFEWAVSAVASIAVHLRQAGYRLRLVTGAGPGSDFDNLEKTGMGTVLDHLADVKLDSKLELNALVDRVRRQSNSGLVLAVLGLTTPDEAKHIAGLHTSGSCLGFLIDSTTWLRLSEPARLAAAKEHELSRLALLHNGWRVVAARQGDTLPSLWHQASARGAQGFAYRAQTAQSASGGGQ